MSDTVIDNVYTERHIKEKEFIFKTKVSVADYITLVEKITNAHFNSKTGAYEPHLGMISAMQLFYEYCVVGSDLDSELPNGVTGLKDIEMVIDEPVFMRKFYNETHKSFWDQLSFGDAYNCAMKMIEDRLHSPERTIQGINKVIKEDLLFLWDKLTSEDMKKLATIVSSEQFNTKGIASSILKNYAQSDAFRKLFVESKIANAVDQQE